jgi:hypothetical protein
MSNRRRSQLEKQIQRDIEADLGAEPDLLLLRNSVGEARYVDEQTGKEWHVPYGLGVGSPDLVGLLRVELRHRNEGDPVVVRSIDGVDDAVFALTRPVSPAIWLCLEVKVPGEEADDHQAKVHDIWRRFGAVVEVVHSVAEARAALERARRLTAEPEREAGDIRRSRTHKGGR